MKSFWLYNSSRAYRPIKLILLFLSLSVWLWWDLSQAAGTVTTAYKSFFLSRDIDGITSTPTAVAIVRSDDRVLANPVDVNDPNDARMGVHSTRAVTWDGTNEGGDIVASGPYLVVLLRDGRPLATKRILFLK